MSSFGFTREHSTEQEVLTLVKYAYDGFQRITVIIFLHVYNSFDRVWQEGLVTKLNRLCYPPGVTQLIDSYLRGRSFGVRVGATLSDIIRLEAGLPHGAVL